MSGLRARQERFLTELGKAQEKRHLMPEDVTDPLAGYTTFRWVLHEREVMLDLVNTTRILYGKNVLPVEDIFRVENRALGHSDYSRKYALYCAELVDVP